MSHTGETSDGSREQLNDLFDAVEQSDAMGSPEFKQFLDLFPIAVIISRRVGDEQRIVYANRAAESLTQKSAADFVGRGWSLLDTYRHENDFEVTLHQAIFASEDEFLGAFQCQAPKSLVEVYAGRIDNEEGAENYRIVALIDAGERARAEREELARQVRDKDFLLKELQHRVRNNLQLITALIRLDARAQQRGETVNLDRLAGRVESLQLLYRNLSTDALGRILQPTEGVDLGHYLSQIASAVMHTYAVEGIRIDMQVDHVPVSVNVALPVGLLVNELLTNAFKYAFAAGEGGVLTLECAHLEEGHCRVVVADDGVGLPEGVTWPPRGKLGALILTTLRENADTNFDVASSPGRGTRVTIELAYKPMAKQRPL
jgi:two-component sensor histidine kinase